MYWWNPFEKNLSIGFVTFLIFVYLRTWTWHMACWETTMSYSVEYVFRKEQKRRCRAKEEMYRWKQASLFNFFFSVCWALNGIMSKDWDTLLDNDTWRSSDLCGVNITSFVDDERPKFNSPLSADSKQMNYFWNWSMIMLVFLLWCSLFWFGLQFGFKGDSCAAATTTIMTLYRLMGSCYWETGSTR